MRKRVLLTGAGGFIGSHVLRHLLAETDWDVVCTDSFRHMGKSDRILQAMRDPEGYVITGWTDRITVIAHDLNAPVSLQMHERIGRADYVIAMASESHVDRSLKYPADFVRNNVNVALSTLEYCRAAKPEHVIWISTDEVYGPVAADDLKGHAEWATILPSNPYSASKAAQEAIAFSYWRSYGLPLTVVNCMNLIGEMQDPEKFLPTLISRISKGEFVTIHGSATDVGTRHYLHARNLADALTYIFRELPAWPYGRRNDHDLMMPHDMRFYPGFEACPPNCPGRRAMDRPQRFNIASADRVSNLELAFAVAHITGKGLKYRLEDFHSTRPGHDAHYGLDPSLLAAAGWKPPVPFAESLERTVKWTLDHPEWLL